MSPDALAAASVPGPRLPRDASPAGLNLGPYDVGDFFDEMFDERRPAARPIASRSTIASRSSRPTISTAANSAAERSMVQLGITFNVYGDPAGQRADHPVRHLSRASSVATNGAWLEARPEAADHRAQHVHRRHLPRAADRQATACCPSTSCATANGFRQQCIGLKPPRGVWCHITGTDLVRDRDGQYLRAGRQPALPLRRVVRAAKPAADEADVSAAVRSSPRSARSTTTAAGCSTRCST